jgi:hypothetical protein
MPHGGGGSLHGQSGGLQIEIGRTVTPKKLERTRKEIFKLEIY